MKLTRYTDYALRIMTHLAKVPDGLVAIHALAAACDADKTYERLQDTQLPPRRSSGEATGSATLQDAKCLHEATSPATRQDLQPLSQFCYRDKKRR